MHRTPPERSTPIWKMTSSAPKLSAGITCWPRAAKQPLAHRARSALRARSTSFTTATSCTSGTAGKLARMLKLSLLLGVLAALADVAGGLVLGRARGVERYLRYFVALGAGFLMATALLEMTPESFKLNAQLAPALIMAGYCAVHLLEHTMNAHFHFGEETHAGEFVSKRTGYSVLGGLSVHALFDGVAIGSGFALSNWLGWLIFLAILLHKAPEGFTMASVMMASGRSRTTAFWSAVA